MYMLEKTEDKAKMEEGSPFGPGFSRVQTAQAKSMEIYCTDFRDPGEECVFVLRDARGLVLAETRVPGY